MDPVHDGAPPPLPRARPHRATSDRWAALLDDLEVPRGGVMGLAASDPLDFAVVFLGIIAAGRVVAPLDPSPSDAELATACDRRAAAVVIADRPRPATVEADWIVHPQGTFDLPGDAVPHPGPAGSLPGSGGLLPATSATTGTPRASA